MKQMTWQGDNRRHSDVQKNKDKDTLRTPMATQDKTSQFKKEVSAFLTKLSKGNKNDTTIPEFRRWLKEELMPFDQKEPFEQIYEKIGYEKEIGNDDQVFHSIKKFLTEWVEKNFVKPDTHIWYHGTTEDRYKKIMADGEIKVSTPDTFQHEGFANDIGTISLAKHKGQAHFFSAISAKGKGNQVILHIDTRKLRPLAMKKRKLISTPDGEMLYSRNIPASAIVRAELV